MKATKGFLDRLFGRGHDPVQEEPDMATISWNDTLKNAGMEYSVDKDAWTNADGSVVMTADDVTKMFSVGQGALNSVSWTGLGTGIAASNTVTLPTYGNQLAGAYGGSGGGLNQGSINIPNQTQWFTSTLNNPNQWSVENLPTTIAMPSPDFSLDEIERASELMEVLA